MSAPASKHKMELGTFWISFVAISMRVLKRFPLPVLFCLLFSAHNLIGAELQTGLPQVIIDHMGWLLGLGFLWTLIVAVWGEAGEKSGVDRALATVLGVIMIFLLIGATRMLHTSPLLLSLTMALVLGLAAHHKLEQQNDTFWQYNKTLWLGAVFSTLGALAVISIPLAVLGLTEYLFALPLPAGIYAKILFAAIMLLAPLFWLTMIPADYNAPPKAPAHRRSDYTASRYSSSQLIVSYALVPVMIINTLVLYRYGFKIWLDGVVPSGRLAAVVLAYTGMGLVSYLMCYPFRQSGGALVRFFWRAWFILSIIPAGLLLLTIAIRVDAYGLTEARYLIGLIAIWHLGVSLAFVVFRVSDLRFIPASLAALFVIGAIGPAGATGASILSQYAQLETLLVNNGRLQHGKLRVGGSAIGAGATTLAARAGTNDAQRIKSILSYLGERDALSDIAPWVSGLRDNPFKIDVMQQNVIAPLLQRKPSEQRPFRQDQVAQLARLMGAPFSPIGTSAARSVVFYARNPALVALKDTVRLAGPINLSLSRNSGQARIKVAPGTGRDLDVVLSERGLTVSNRHGRLAYFDLARAAKTIAWFEDKQALVPALTSPRIVKAARGDLKVRLVLTSLQGQRARNGRYAFKQISCWLLLYKK